jgi:hypothetical protein
VFAKIYIRLAYKSYRWRRKRKRNKGDSGELNNITTHPTRINGDLKLVAEVYSQK